MTLYKFYGMLMALVTGVLLTLLTFVMIFQAFAFSKSFYLSGFRKYDVASIVNISDDDLVRVTDEMVSYLDNMAGDLHVKVSIEGNSVEYFNAKEQAHLTDIMNIVRHARRLLTKAQMVFIGLFLLTLITLRGKMRLNFLRVAVVSAFASLALLTVFYFMDFSWAFTKFHEMLFYNDLWLLDPIKDRLLQMMPLPFFMRFTAYILGAVLLMQIIYFAIYQILKPKPQRALYKVYRPSR